MKGFLFDENLPRVSLNTTLPVLHATDVGSRASDTELWNFAQANELVIVTKDADFSQRIVLSAPPPWVVHLRVGNMRRHEFLVWVAHVWPQIEMLIPQHKLLNVSLETIEAIK